MSEPGAVRELLELLDWKRTVFASYAGVRAAGDDHEAAWRGWRAARDRLFASHPQSPVPAERRDRFASLPYFAYDRAMRVEGRLEGAPAERMEIATSGEPGDAYAFTRFARVSFELRSEALSLHAYWLEGYGGGLFLPFRDTTSGRETYGAGRYLFDSVKGADLGTNPDGTLVLDFNFAYNPSCSYDPRWVCPLAPPGNRLAVRIDAGERYDAAAPYLPDHA